MSANSNPGNFANRPKDEVREIASKGGHASGGGNSTESTETHGGDTSNRGFASMDPDKHHEIASKGGQASSGSFEPGSEKAREAGRNGGLATGSD
ncbi:conidiation-specific protein 10 [Diaporthe sp. PMI_573]|nr:conidiation-specific protein 10 [Diaporthaceae sp. PMI_573]